MRPWFAEGITSYYDLTFPLLAGLTDRPTLVKDLGDELSRVLTAPGRRIQSLAASAEEAWVKLYKSSAVSPDSQISYYRLGAATAFCLDVRLRVLGSSLATQLRGLWTTHGRSARGFHRGDLTALLQPLDPGWSMTSTIGSTFLKHCRFRSVLSASVVGSILSPVLNRTTGSPCLPLAVAP